MSVFLFNVCREKEDRGCKVLMHTPHLFQWASRRIIFQWIVPKVHSRMKTLCDKTFALFSRLPETEFILQGLIPYCQNNGKLKKVLQTVC